MPAPARPFHGGDLAAAIHQFGGDVAEWLDLSTGINPVHYPVDAVPERLWTALPDSGVDAMLTQAASAYLQAPDTDWIAPAPGTQMLIQWLPFLRSPGQVVVVGPTYGEHAPAWQRARHQVVHCTRDGLARAAATADVVVVVNPNNPDGAVNPPDELRAHARTLEQRGGWLVVDEAFIDPTPSLSVIDARTPPNVIALRSFGKFFGLAGARLGFAVAAPSLARTISDAMGRWAVPGPTARVAARAMGDQAWIAATTARLADDTTRLDTILAEAGLSVLGGTTLFRLAEHPEAATVHDALARARILVRPFPEARSRLRFGVPAHEHERQRLREALGVALTPSR